MKMKKRLLSILLSLVLVLGLVPGMSLTAYADGEPSVTISPANSGTVSKVSSSSYASDKVPGTGAIWDPVAPTDAGWNGSYVYYGKYDGSNPTKYRVLDKDAAEFGGNNMFLDCDSILYYDSFNKNNDSGNVWAGSNVKTGLNGEKFLEKSDNFSDIEKAAIASSTVREHDLVKADDKNKNEEGKVAPWTYTAFGKYVPLNMDKVFLLDVEDVSNIKYGYRMTDSDAPERLKKDQAGEINIWWLRSANTELNYCAGCCMYDYSYSNGDLNRNDVCFELGVSPAFNVDLQSVIFTSLIPETSNEYKLTLLDNNIKITTANCSKSGNTVTVPYTLAGENAANVTRISALITDEPYSPGTDMTDGYAYEKLDVKTAGTGTFTIPDSFKDKEWGKDYHVYILAEDENDGKETDYASAPVELYTVAISQTVTFKVVNGSWNEGEGEAATADKTVTLTGYEGDTLKLSADQIPAVGNKPNDTYKAGSWDVTPSTETAITEDTTYTYTYAAKEAAVVTKAPEAKTLTYTGSAQALVTAGTATGGTMQYAIGTKDAATQPYTTSIPTATDAGTYYVWYKVQGDDNHNDTTAEKLEVTINAPVFGTPDFTLPASIRTIGDNAFEGAAMTIVDARSCTAIGAGAFKNCANLEQISIPGNCTIGAGAFKDCGTVFIFAPSGSAAESYCRTSTNCVFIAYDHS